MIIDDTTTQELQTALRGNVIRRDGDSYDEARRIFNARIDRRPQLIARCAGAADVIQAVGFARAHGLEIAVRAGGHNVTGNALVDDGIVVIALYAVYAGDVSVGEQVLKPLRE